MTDQSPSSSTSPRRLAGRLDGRLALITGASRGIGKAVAEAFAREGAHCVLVARTVGALEEVDDLVRAAGGSATLVPLDLKEGEALDRMGASLYERWGKLDIFVANAGLLGPLSPVAHIKPNEFEALWKVNVEANQRLIRSLDPLLRLSDAGRAIFVSSGVARKPRAYWGGYGATKAALEQLAFSYAAENVNTKIRVNVVNPGAMRTRMRAQAMPAEDPATLPEPEAVAPLFVELAAPDCSRHGALVNFRETAYYAER